MRTTQFVLTTLVMAAFVGGCDASSDKGTATLYRNSPLESAVRVHIASFDADESGDFNLGNCGMASRILNANIDASAAAEGKKPYENVGFWCEPGPFSESGPVPNSFEREYPSDSRLPLRW